MPSPLQPTSSSPAAPSGATDIPADWPALWSHILRARETAAGRPTGQPGEPWSERSAALQALYQPLLDARVQAGGAPWVVAQLGQSLDGFVATATGDSYYVNGAHGLLHLHRLRALCDAVLVGAGTVATDNPQLTTRRVPGPQPVRVVIDPTARLDGHARVFRDGQAPSLWVCDARHAAAARARLPGDGASGPHPAEVLAVDGLLDEGAGLHAYRPGHAVAA